MDPPSPGGRHDPPGGWIRPQQLRQGLDHSADGEIIYIINISLMPTLLEKLIDDAIA